VKNIPQLHLLVYQRMYKQDRHKNKPPFEEWLLDKLYAFIMDFADDEYLDYMDNLIDDKYIKYPEVKKAYDEFYGDIDAK